MRQVCRTCRKEQPIESFHRDKRLKGGRKRQCVACARIAALTAYRKRVYGLEADRVQEMLLAQQFKCLICQKPFGTNRHGLPEFHVDHCHSTLAIRGLLCGMCNPGIGRFGEDVSLISRAIEYLRTAGPNDP